MEAKLSFEESFAKSLAEVREGKIAATVSLMMHPHGRMLVHDEDGPPDPSQDIFAAWRGADLPWIGAAVWAYPASLEKEMIAARCGATFSHGHANAEDDQAYIEHLGPLGAQVGGTQWSPSAFGDEKLGIDVCVGNYEPRSGSRGGALMEGSPRPSYWPEPLPMVKRLWKTDDPPEKSPNFAAAALCLAVQQRRSVAKAILEETDATAEQVESLLGGVLPLDPAIARHFARQEHPMFGATKLDAEKHEEAARLVDVARVAFEAPSIARAAGPGAESEVRGPRL